MEKLTLGLFAHVDAGKTTIAESILFHSGVIRNLGRVDSKDSYLDYDPIERERGITVFSKNARIKYKDCDITLMDTPGHIDFSSETERTARVLDYAILIISSRDGIQSHTETLWKILEKNRIPTFVFVNKMDLADSDRLKLLSGLHKELSQNCIDFESEPNVFYENIALCDESAMEYFLENGSVPDSVIVRLIKDRKVFPCFFGSALKDFGVSEFLDGIIRFAESGYYSDDFSATVYKITRDKQGNRLTHLKITGGKLCVKDTILYSVAGFNEIIQEKVNAIRLYSGEKYETVNSVYPGDICAVTGLTKSFAGQYINSCGENNNPILEPVISYEIILPKEIDAISFLPKIKEIEEEDPLLKTEFSGSMKNIKVFLMGGIQADVLKKVIYDRYGIEIEFGSGEIQYKETIVASVEGVGHFEPLRHYAEVHLLLEPSLPGSGITIRSNCSESVLDRNWQHLIMNHISEKAHKGVLTGSPITDIAITLTVGRSHVKHTEGGDFREATYRAIRQGLMKAQSILLEPYYLFKLIIPTVNMGNAISDIKSMGGTIISTISEGDRVIIEGRAPVSEMQEYYKNVISYTKGYGKLSCINDGYYPCHNQKEIIEKINYVATEDLENTPDSVFCSHGSGTIIKWNEVEKYMHVSSGMVLSDNGDIPYISNVSLFKSNLNIDDRELEEIMDREFGPIKRKQYSSEPEIEVRGTQKTSVLNKSHCIIIDGYNLLFALKKKIDTDDSLDLNRHLIIEMLSNYNGFIKDKVILVFDGYKVKDNPGEKIDYKGINIVYTKENETADMYIERLINEIGKNYNVKVVTSDNLIQISAVKSGVLRISSNEFINEMSVIGSKINELISKYGKIKGYKPFEELNSTNNQ